MKSEKSQSYEFCLFRIPENGGRVLWEITNRCNYPCGYCIFSCNPKEDPNELTTEEVENALNGLHQKNFTNIKFTGGEPFIRKDFMQILRRAKKLGLNLDISTNASLISPATASELSDLVDMVHVSVDGHNREVHEEARGKGTYKPTIRGLNYLTQSGNYVRVGTVIFKGNERHLESTVQSISSIGANEIIFSFMEPVGRLNGDTRIISTRTIEDVKTEIKSLAEKYPQIKVNYSFTEAPTCEQGRCPAVGRFLYIDNHGRLSPCTWVVGKFPQYRTNHTLKDTRFEDLIKAPEINSYLDSLNQTEVQGCPVRRRL
jgi:MoaA/NifB/PqqE/SkfB family radical SAM enzyme